MGLLRAVRVITLFGNVVHWDVQGSKIYNQLPLSCAISFVAKISSFSCKCSIPRTIKLDLIIPCIILWLSSKTSLPPIHSLILCNLPGITLTEISHPGCGRLFLSQLLDAPLNLKINLPNSFFSILESLTKLSSEEIHSSGKSFHHKLKGGHNEVLKCFDRPLPLRLD